MRELRQTNGSAPDVLKLPGANKNCAIASNIRAIVQTETRSPIILYICQESEYEALRRYKPLRHCDLTRCYPYFDPQIDTIFFHYS